MTLNKAALTNKTTLKSDIQSFATLCRKTKNKTHMALKFDDGEGGQHQDPGYKRVVMGKIAMYEKSETWY